MCPCHNGESLAIISLVNRPMVSENYTQCKVPAHGAVTTFQKDQDSRNYSQNSPIHPIKKPSKRRLTIVKSQNRRLGDLGQMVPSGRILIFRARERHIGHAQVMFKKCHWPVGPRNCRNCQGNGKDLADHHGPSRIRSTCNTH